MTAMNCDHFRERLSAMHDGELDADSARQVTDHVEGCPACAAALAELQTLRAFVRRQGRSPVPAGLLARIEDRAEVAAVRTGGVAAWLMPRLAAAGFGALCVGGAWWFSSAPDAASRPGLPEPVASYLRVSNVTTTLDEIERLQRRPENRVLAWARLEAKKR